MSLLFSGRLLFQLILLLCLPLLLAGCGDNDRAGSKRKQSPHIVETVKAGYRNISIERTLSGTLQPLREVRIINEIQGLLIDMPVYPGDRVSKGQTLARLNDSLVKAELQKARATLDQARLDLRRLQNLAPKKLASESEVAQARTQVDIAQAELQLKQTEFEHTLINSPIDGVVSQREVEQGDVVPLHTHLLSVIDTSSLKAEISISELLLPSINIGSEVSIAIDALGAQKFPGKITRIYPSIDRNTRKGTIEVMLSPVPEGALAGQLCRVNIKTPEQSRLMIPYDAMRHDKQGAHVFVVEAGKAHRVNITTGIQQDDFIEVIDGLQEQQTIVSKGFFGLKNDMEVKSISQAETVTE